jgi:hypothetical protein
MFNSVKALDGGAWASFQLALPVIMIYAGMSERFAQRYGNRSAIKNDQLNEYD